MNVDNPSPIECPVCNEKKSNPWSSAKDYEYFSTNNTYIYYRCPACDTIFIDPLPVHELKVIYPSNYYSFVNKRKNGVVRLKEWLDKRFFKKIFRQLPAPELSLLDVGGGTGWMLDILKRTDPRIHFTQIVDIDAKAKSIAEVKGHAYFEGTIEAFTTDNRFDLILMLNLVEHVADPLAILQKAQLLLQPGGIIVIKTPNTDCWDARLYKKTYWGGLHCPRHWVLFSEKSFRLLLKSTKLRIEKLTYTQGAPFWAFSIITSLYRKHIVRISSERPIIFHWLFAPLSAFFAIFDFMRRPFVKTSQMFIILKN